MVLIKLLIPLALLFFGGCAKVSYLWDQGWGQISLLKNARPNKEVLRDPSVAQEAKDKIKRIEELKHYFYRYWGKEEGKIYSETTFLKTKAVTHLVIASPFNEIKAINHCFPIMGCFPYLGFFSRDKAQNFARELKEESFETFIRPVYAYSTLGYFEDKILSSFFYYDDFQLTELIFHELFHTIFFVKDEVSLNEALANHFGRLMAFEYYDLTDNQKKTKIDKRAKNAALSATFAKEIHLFNEVLKKENISEEDSLKKFRQSYLNKILLPRIEKFCEREQIASCFPLKREWNNASLAAFMTYEDKGVRIFEHQKRLGLDLIGYLKHIEEAYKSYKKHDFKGKKIKFDQWLFKNI